MHTAGVLNSNIFNSLEQVSSGHIFVQKWEKAILLFKLIFNIPGVRTLPAKCLLETPGPIAGVSNSNWSEGNILEKKNAPRAEVYKKKALVRWNLQEKP